MLSSSHSPVVTASASSPPFHFRYGPSVLPSSIAPPAIGPSVSASASTLAAAAAAAAASTPDLVSEGLAGAVVGESQAGLPPVTPTAPATPATAPAPVPTPGHGPAPSLQAPCLSGAAAFTSASGTKAVSPLWGSDIISSSCSQSVRTSATSHPLSHGLQCPQTQLRSSSQAPPTSPHQVFEPTQPPKINQHRSQQQSSPGNPNQHVRAWPTPLTHQKKREMDPTRRDAPHPAAPCPPASATTSAPSSPSKQSLQSKSPADRPQPNPLSPSKRRNPSVLAPGPWTAIHGTATIDPPRFDTAADPDSPSKRLRPESHAKVLPIRYETMEVDDLVMLISHMLGELIATNDPMALTSGRLTRFHSRFVLLCRHVVSPLTCWSLELNCRTAPAISVRDYLHRLAKHATLTPAVLLSMVYYIDRLCLLYPDFTINTLTVHRFLITAATVGAKGLSDSFWNNTTYARVGGVRVQELKTLELEFLKRVDWKIVPQPKVLAAYYKGLVKRCPGYILEDDVEASHTTTTDNSPAGPSQSDTTEPVDDDKEEDAKENPMISRAESEVGAGLAIGSRLGLGGG